MAFGMKYIAQGLVDSGCFKYAYYFSYLQHAFLGTAKKDHFLISEEAEEIRLNVNTVQECFVMAHELGHFISEQPSSSEIHSIIEETRGVLLRASPGISHKESVDKRYGAGTFDALFVKSDENIAVRTLEENTGLLLGELLSDRLAVALTFDVCKSNLNIPASQICEGILLCVKYMRLIHHLDFSVEKISKAYGIKDVKSRMRSLSEIKDGVWGGEQDRRIMLASIRERRLRSQMYMHVDLTGESALEVHEYLSNRADEYDLRIEFPVVFDMIGNLPKLVDHKSKLMKDANGMADSILIEMADKATRWGA